ncbi:uncharacterized protein HMPREF1541_01001 [Cyphellophora europaea CBS 101466]|uniref:Zn(2)-C6 fungal-type domain-containing protein n=1 Tax=Cyphellophora europaea (strain CBS 101466) TaxID=1220924 RepID=W2SDP2_CYPE1|nr:uncharacterized protein HMPREF1541_01001 [Cyphellophora europaea CBS 101466]ETN46812.1 hypothetical protein HMPREF1541_01001 [Cyphellophora europaea CBS 101466]
MLSPPEARRVKCDEEKPACRRCVKGGRQCNYELPKSRRDPNQLVFVNYSSTVPAIRSVSPQSHIDPVAQRSLAFFKERAAVALGGPFSSHFWSEGLLLLAEHESSVRYALVALGCVYEDFALCGKPRVSDYALRQYGKAIQGVVDLRISQNPYAVEVALATCILFACLESLRCFYHSCLSHLAAGIRVFQDHKSITRPERASILPTESLQTIFVRLDSQLVELGGPKFGERFWLYNDADATMPETLHSMDEAMRYLELLLNRIEWFLRKCEHVATAYGTAPLTLAPLYEEKQYYRSEYQVWRGAFDRLMALPSTDTSCVDRETSILSVNLLSTTIAIILEVDILDAELDFDLCLPLFQSIVADAERFIARSASYSVSHHPPSPHTSPLNSSNDSSSGTPLANSVHQDQRHVQSPQQPTPTILPTFSMSIGCVLPLYLVASRCRHSATRHRALHLLKHCNRREGIYDAAVAASIAERLIMLEESNAKATQDASGNAATTTATDADDDLQVPEEVRVKSLNLQYNEDEEGGRAEFSMQFVGEVSNGGRDGGMAFTELIQW